MKRGWISPWISCSTGWKREREAEGVLDLVAEGEQPIEYSGHCSLYRCGDTHRKIGCSPKKKGLEKRS